MNAKDKDNDKGGKGRFISFNADLEPGGLLQGLRDLVAENKDLQLCYRGNSGDVIVVYYNNHIMFKVKKYTQKYKNKQFLLTISFNHARYEKDWQEILYDLQKNHHFEKRGNKKIADEDDDGYLICRFNNSDDIKWKELYELLKSLMNNFFDDTNVEVTDYFKKDLPLVRKKRYKEKQWQQRIFSANANYNDGYFIYDMEFAKPHENKNEADNDGNNNEPDMLAIKYEKTKPVKLAIIEVKSTWDACEDPKSGACEHIRKTAGELDKFFKTEEKIFIETRIEEAEDIIKGYATIKLRELEQTPNLDFGNLDFEILMVFTDYDPKDSKDKTKPAIPWAKSEKNIEKMKEAAQGYQQKLVFATVKENGELDFKKLIG